MDVPQVRPDGQPPAHPALTTCWWCRRQAQPGPSGWPLGMAMTVRDGGVAWQCTDSKSCLRRTVARLVEAERPPPPDG
jgi:hypothetical protein